MDVLINIDVPDLAKAIDFYTQALHLRIGRRFGAGGVELLGGTSRIYLLVKPSGSAPFEGVTEKRSYTRHWSPVHLDFVVEALEPALKWALAAGAKQEGEIREANWGRIVLLSDPFGHGLCLLQFKGRGYDEIATAG